MLGIRNGCQPQLDNTQSRTAGSLTDVYRGVPGGKCRRLACSASHRIAVLSCAENRPPIPGGAVLLVANHPNALLDPALVQTTAGRPVRFLAKSTLFRGHVLGPIIRRSGAIPVYRRIDAGVDPARNVEAFATVEAVLARGEVVCVFPEGISHSTGRLEPLRTGAARMTLASLARGTRVTLMPIGLHFHRLVSFRSRATVAYGVPFDCADLAAAYCEAPGDAVQALTERIGRHLRELLVEADPRTELQIIDRVERLYSAARGVARTPDAAGRTRPAHAAAEQHRKGARERPTPDRAHGDVTGAPYREKKLAGIVKLRLTAAFDAQYGGFATDWSPVSWGSLDELFVNLTMPLQDRPAAR